MTTHTTRMKKQIRTTLLAVTLFCAAFTQYVQAQDVDQELATFTQQVQSAYNKEDFAALQSFYTSDATLVTREGASISGAEAIGAFWAEQFKEDDLTLTLTQTLVSWSDANYGYLAKGVYQANGSSAKGEAITISGTYGNVMLKQNGAWKIYRSHLGE